MAFDDQEVSVASGDIIELYKFIYGTEAAEFYAYTNHVEEITLEDGDVFTPVPITRDSIETNGTLDKSAIKISTDVGTELAEIFRVYPPSHVVTLVIRHGHLDANGDIPTDEEFVVVWAGRIVAASREHGELVMSGEPVSTSLRRPGLRRHYQIGCPHELYGPQCQANKALATVSSTVSAIAGATVTLPGGWNGAFAAEKFLGGLLEWEADGGSTARRTILRITGNTLSLSGIPIDLAVTDAVDVVLGCNHKAFAAQGGDCQPLHNNILNYGGDLWIPLKNTIGAFNHYF